MKIIDYYLKTLGVFILVSMATKYQLLLDLPTFNQLWQVSMAVIYIAAGLIGSVGIIRHKKWGFIPTYIHIFVATFFMSISIIPFVFDLFDLKSLALISCNLTLLFVTAFCHGIMRVGKQKVNLPLES